MKKKGKKKHSSPWYPCCDFSLQIK
jgi:hypothetical protein